MAMADNDAADLDSLLNCIICTEPFTNPKVLPCQHTFCLNCLQRSYDYNYRERLTAYGQFSCPTCRTIVVIPRNGLEGLPNDFKIGQIRDFFEKLSLSISSKDTEGGQVCRVCKFEGRSIRPEFYCIQCSKHLCDTCAGQHGQNPLFKTHTTISIESNNFKSLECQDHQEEIKFYCLACSDLLCTICVLGKHAKHHVKDLTTATEKQHEAISIQLAVLRSRLQQFEDKADQLDQLRKTKELIFQENQLAIEEQGKVLAEQVLEAQQQMLQDLELQHQATMQQLEREEENTDVRIGNISSLCDFAAGMMEPEQAFKLMAMYTHLNSRMESMATTECSLIPKKIRKVYKFNRKQDPSLGELQLVQLKHSKMSHDLGSHSQLESLPAPLSLKHRSRSTTTEHSDNGSQGEVFDLDQIGFSQPALGGDGPNSRWEIDTDSGTLTLRHRRVESPCQAAMAASPTTTRLLWKKIGLHGARDVTFLPNMNVVITESKNRSDHLKLFDKDGNHIRHATGSRRNWMRPWGVAYSQQTASIAITDQKNLTVKVLDEEFKVKQGLKCMFVKPSGIAISKRNNFIITDTSDNKQCVSIYTADGQLLGAWGSPGNANYQFNNPEYITTDHNGRIIVSDNLNHCVKIFDEEGQFIAKFSQLDPPSRSLTNPEGVCVDAHNNILVAHGSNISMFSPDGSFLAHLEMTDIQRRLFSFLRDDRFYGIAVHNSGLLAVTTDSTLYVYEVPILKSSID